ncbi:hypothetical protein [Virgibacillus salexigens]|uniref:hypothetical protein n=1 Tax=Virgibacillus TaxID=84406 RepID=UPI00056F76A6|nr:MULTISPECIES: hypothetical protein [Virgibacillus]
MRRAEKNRKFITKLDMVKSLSKVYQLYLTDELPLGNVHILLDDFLWGWTEYNGKHKGCKWWSDRAYEQYANREKNKTKGLIHDHVVPRNVIRHEVLEMLYNKCSNEDLYKFLEENLIGCVITKEEDNMLRNLGLRDVLGSSLNSDTVWNRYETAKISITKVIW